MSPRSEKLRRNAQETEAVLLQCIGNDRRGGVGNRQLHVDNFDVRPLDQLAPRLTHEPHRVRADRFR